MDSRIPPDAKECVDRDALNPNESECTHVLYLQNICILKGQTVGYHEPASLKFY